MGIISFLLTSSDGRVPWFQILIGFLIGVLGTLTYMAIRNPSIFAWSQSLLESMNPLRKRPAVEEEEKVVPPSGSAAAVLQMDRVTGVNPDQILPQGMPFQNDLQGLLPFLIPGSAVHINEGSTLANLVQIESSTEESEQDEQEEDDDDDEDEANEDDDTPVAASHDNHHHHDNAPDNV